MLLPPGESLFVQTVMDEIPTLFVHNESRIPHDPQMLRDRALRNVKPCRQRVHAKRPSLEKLNNSHTRWNRQDLQYSSQPDWVFHENDISIL